MKNLFSFNKIFLIFGLFTVIMFLIIESGCKPKDNRPYGPRYEEDPGPERGTVAERLNGIWKIEDYLLNDVSIINQASVATSGSISINDVHWDYIMPTKDNDWHESSIVYPSKWFAFISTDKIKFDGRDTSFCYWLVNPLQRKAPGNTDWKIIKLYQNSLHIKLITTYGEYKIFWKK